MLPLRWIAAGVVWLLTMAAGLTLLIDYKSTAGAAAPAPMQWPVESTIARGDKATLIMFLHPHCACSRASVAEMGRLLQRIGDRVSLRVVMVRPPGAPAGFEQGGLRESALALPNAVVVDDDQSVEAARFGAVTSGTCVLYDRTGKLAFHGGITALRGHEGNSFGQERIVSLLTMGSADRGDSPVFGCELGTEEKHSALDDKARHGSR